MSKISDIQAILGVTADGAWGPKSQAALDAAKGEGAADTAAATGAAPGATEDGGLVDPRSEIAIATLHRKVQPIARKLVKLAAANGIVIKITSGTRTYAEQDKLFAQGGVTHARGGQSNHNFGLAFDQTIFDGPQPVWESPLYKKVGALGESVGLSWGGRWTSIVDEPHFELRPPWAASMSEGQMLAELRRRHDNGIDAFA
jgi:peptidoglycan L-alanyl-D-glutamate endopeptidase CwlK